MLLLDILVIAVSLGIDAFAVAVSVGILLGRPNGRQVFRLSFHFGLFQFLMPVIGWYAGSLFVESLRAVDHWIAFAILAGLGVKVLKDALSGEAEGAERFREDPTRKLSLVVLSVATSIDALAVGVTLAFMSVDIVYVSVVIGLVACLMTLAGLYAGRLLGLRVSRYAGVAGGLLLVAVGTRILYEHTLGAPPVAALIP